MRGRRYRVAVSFTLANAGGTADLLSVAPAANKPLALVWWQISQVGEVAEAQEEEIRIQVTRVPATVTAGSGGTAITAANIPPVLRSSAVAGFTARYNDTTPATSSGTIVVLDEVGWNERATPLKISYDDEDSRPDAINGESLVITTPTTVADDAVVQITAEFEEVG